mmetsp:Transcript_23398/g.53037  ORF Transcript_23398/g.53037 Transcript_23398/m.53037 type:complete len:292 (-) Transcript_23398:331-1206(-)
MPIISNQVILLVIRNELVQVPTRGNNPLANWILIRRSQLRRWPFLLHRQAEVPAFARFQLSLGPNIGFICTRRFLGIGILLFAVLLQVFALKIPVALTIRHDDSAVVLDRIVRRKGRHHKLDKQLRVFAGACVGDDIADLAGRNKSKPLQQTLVDTKPPSGFTSAAVAADHVSLVLVCWCTELSPWEDLLDGEVVLATHERPHAALIAFCHGDEIGKVFQSALPRRWVQALDRLDTDTTAVRKHHRLKGCRVVFDVHELLLIFSYLCANAFITFHSEVLETLGWLQIGWRI